MQIKSGGPPAGGTYAGERLPEPIWRTGPLAATHLVVIFLLVTWLLPFSRGVWDQLDAAVFRFLNGSLGLGEWWQVLWALGNHRSTDYFSGTLMVLLFISWLWGRPRDIQNMKCAIFSALALVMGAVIISLHPLINKWIGYIRPSPTLVLDDVMLLSDLVPSIDAKIIAKSSFPGDHAFILGSYVLFFWYLGPRRIAAVVSVLAFVFLLPRLIGGAHWLTDDLMGGVIPALLVSSWVLATPLGYYMARLFLPLVKLVIFLIPGPLRIPESMDN